jgi:hypothetical protein
MQVRQLLPLMAATNQLPRIQRKLALWENVVLGGASAGIAGAAVFPLDTVKSRMMNGQVHCTCGFSLTCACASD